MKALFKSKIYHKRFLPRVNEFSYSGYYIKFSLDAIDNLKSKVFSVEGFNLFSFYKCDHGYRDGTSLKGWVIDTLKLAGVFDFNGKVELQTFPRVMGYVFNPVSFWYCYQDEKIIAVICEVNNTFGESHNYVLKNDPTGNVISLNKCFHVSPFYDVKGSYKFDFRRPDSVKIDYYLNDVLQLNTAVKGEEIPFTDLNLMKLFIKYPLFTLFNVFLIHFQALKLFMKKNKFYSKPEKVNCEVTYE